jgi:hypothetical protein
METKTTMNELLFDAQLKDFMEDILELAKKQPEGKEYRVFVVCNGFKRDDVVDMLVSVESGISYSKIVKALNTGGIAQLGEEEAKKFMEASDRMVNEYNIALSENMPDKKEWDEVGGDAYIVFVINYPKYFEEMLIENSKK